MGREWSLWAPAVLWAKPPSVEEKAVWQFFRTQSDQESHTFSSCVDVEDDERFPGHPTPSQPFLIKRLAEHASRMSQGLKDISAAIWAVPFSDHLAGGVDGIADAAGLAEAEVLQSVGVRADHATDQTTAP